MIFLIGFSIATFLCLLLLMKKGKTQSDFVLLLWLAVTAIHQFFMYGETSGLFFKYPHMLGIGFPFPMFQGILLLFYAKSMVSGQKLRFKEIFPHLLPPLVLIALAIPFHLLTGAEKVAVYQNAGKGYETYLFIRLIFMFTSGVGYVVWTVFLLRKHRATLENEFSNTAHKNLRWLQYLSLAVGLIWMLAFFFDDTVIYAGVTGFVLFIGFYGIHQTPIFQSNRWEKLVPENGPTYEILAKDAETNLDEPARYAKSGLKNEDIERIYDQLNTQMAQKSPYKNPEFTLADLAKTLDIHPNYLSQVINEREQKNFYHYINTLRVEEFLRLAALPKNRQFTLMALAYDCGFNSKTTFNKYFKHHTGKTPSEFFKGVH